MTKDNKTFEPKNETASSDTTKQQANAVSSKPEQTSKSTDAVIKQEKTVDKKAKNNPVTDRSFSTQHKPTSQSTSPSASQSPKKGGSALALLAIIIALGVGAGGYYLGQQKFSELEQKLNAVEDVSPQTPVLLNNNDEELAQLSAQLSQVTADYQASQNKLADLEQQLNNKQQDFDSLKQQVNKINNVVKAEPNDWVLSEVDFLLNNALRKLVLDADVDTAIALLQVASQSLEQIADADVVPIRKALNEDLKQLLAVNNIDQNEIMQQLSLLANKLDELEILNVNFGNDDNPQLSDSMQDWQENVKKSAVSFLNHFIRITPKSANDKALLAPNQDIYLRENIRLRLQIAILAVPRQQNELYKQSLEAVAAWVRSYFNTNTETAQNFLQQVDKLMEQSIYIDVPTKLTSLTLLDQLLHRQGQDVQRIELRVDKALTESAEQQADQLVTPQQTNDAVSDDEQAQDSASATTEATATQSQAEPADEQPAKAVTNPEQSTTE